MVPVLLPGQLGQEIMACASLGLCIGAARAVFPLKGRAAVLPDFLLVGAVLMALQSYAAGESAAGVLRWYMAAAAFTGVGAACAVLGVPLGVLRRGAMQLLRLPRRLAARFVLRPAARHFAARKARRNAKRPAQNAKKTLPNQRRMLYNSNVSK